LHVDFAHVRHVKQSGVGSGPQMFFDRAGRILDRHVPSAKVDHATTGLAVCGIQWRSFKLWGYCSHARMFRLLLSRDIDKIFRKG
jgi:hypothetical protein